MYSNQDLYTLDYSKYLDNTMLQLRHSFISSIYAILQHNKMKFMCEPKPKILI